MNTLRNSILSPTVRNEPSNIFAGELHWSDDSFLVTAAGIPVLLRPIEFRLLGHLMSHAGRVHTRTELLAKLGASCIGERTIDVHIRRLRMSLQPFGMDRWIQTAPSRGYRFSPLHH
ncbi:winged helix-turn-helix domain-containing protein [Gallionella capsiferriformans]|uniref:winged helix-turn-helix domain-containing protein n=1 Tax=Gallionella capsiferriformans TaxID=370405 RepID=UPI0001AB2551|nr:winged helix-turn-helix domain-containing protein [Gallionella capsiferriformans]